MTNLREDVEALWDIHHEKYEGYLESWHAMIKQGETTLRNARQQFHQWAPLMVYVSVGKAIHTTSPIFSLRFLGQEVGQIVIRDAKHANLQLIKGKSATNKKYFTDFPFTDGVYPWNGKVAQQFRSYFKKKNAEFNGILDLRSEEHRVESKFINEMLQGSRKFGGIGIQIKPVMIAGCPLQFPLPISANTGKPIEKPGHIDILARRKTGNNKVILSVWELKKPKEYKAAAKQSYIYAVTLIKILRSHWGSHWYKVFGFDSPLPQSLMIEAVVAITSNQLGKFEKEKKNLIHCNTPFEINGDRLTLDYVCYEERHHNIVIKETSLNL